MRLDKFLKVSRLIKRRTVANEVSDMGRVFVNGNPAKPAKQIKENDIIEIEYATRTTKAKVLKKSKNFISTFYHFSSPLLFSFFLCNIHIYT